MGTKPNSLKRAVALIAAACTLGTCCIAGSIAWANGEGDQEKVDTANIITGKNTSITLHKYDGGDSNREIDGNEIANPDTDSLLSVRKPVQGVVFTIWRMKKKTAKGDVEINLSQSEGWKNIAGLLDNLVRKHATGEAQTAKTASELAGTTFVEYSGEGTGIDKKSGLTCTTKEDGSCEFPNLPMGLYYIKETDNSKAKKCTKEVKGEKTTYSCEPVSIKTPVAPFFVTTPLPDPKAKDPKNAWIYDVHVYPKNDVVSNRPSKVIEKLNRNDFVAGDKGTNITWKISIPILQPKDGKEYEKIGFVDKLVDGLVYKDASAQIITLNDKGVEQGTAVPLTKPGDGVTDNDYDVTHDDNTGVVRFTLTKPTDTKPNTKGLEKALKAYKNAANGNTAILVVKLVTGFKDNTTVKNFANVANTFVDDTKTGKGDDTKTPCAPGSKDPECDDTTPTDTAYFGTLTVDKFVQQTDTDKTKLPLENAEFKVFEITGTHEVQSGNTKKTVPYELKDVKSVDVNKSGDSTTYTFRGDKQGLNDSGPEIKSVPVNATLITKKKTVKVNNADVVKALASVDLFVYKKTEERKGTTKLYCAVETKAPDGYKLDTAPHCVNLAANSEGVAPVGDTLPVPNSKATELDKILAALPMTGARGLVILTVCGIVGIAGTFFYIVMKRRKEQEAE